MREQVVLFGRAGSLAGILTEPCSDPADSCLPAIVILDAGLLHRVGPNRLHVKIARRMASAGFPVLRFDFSGIGESRPRDDNLPFERSSISETQEAMHYLSSERDIRKFVLIGLCSGANVAFKAACHDEQVIGAIGINGSYLDNQMLERLNPYVENSIRGRYYRKRILNYRSWWRVVTGKSDLRSIMRYLLSKGRILLSRKTSVPAETNPSLEWNPLIERGVDLFLIYSEGSGALDTFRLLHEEHLNKLRTSGKLLVEVVENTDHVFTLLWAQEFLMDLMQRWVQSRERSWIGG